jgi:hypothetical protein
MATGVGRHNRLAIYSRLMIWSNPMGNYGYFASFGSEVDSNLQIQMYNIISVIN